MFLNLTIWQETVQHVLIHSIVDANITLSRVIVMQNGGGGGGTKVFKTHPQECSCFTHAMLELLRLQMMGRKN